MADVNNERNIQEADKKRQGLRQNANPAAQAPVNPAAAAAAENPSLRNFKAAKDEAQAARLAAEPPKNSMGISFSNALPGADTRQASKNIQAAKNPTAVEPTKGLGANTVPPTAVEPAKPPTAVEPAKPPTAVEPTTEPPPQAAQAPANPAAVEAAKNPSLRNFIASIDEAQAAWSEEESPKSFMDILSTSLTPVPVFRRAWKNYQDAKNSMETGPATEPTQEPGAAGPEGFVGPEPKYPSRIRSVNGNAILASADPETGRYSSFTGANIDSDGNFVSSGPSAGIAAQNRALSDGYMDRMNRASLASADYVDRMNRTRDIYADMRQMRRGSGQGSGVNVIRDEARELRNARMALDDRGDGLRPRGAYGNLMAAKMMNRLLDGQGGQGGWGGQAAQAGAGGLRGAGATDPMQHVKDSIEAQKAQVELEKARRGTPVDPYKEAKDQTGFLQDETELAKAQRERMGVLGNDVLRAMGEDPNDPAASARLQAAVANITSAGQVEIGKDKDGKPIMRDFDKLKQSEQAQVLHNAIVDRSILDAFADELEGLGYDRNMVYNPGFLDQLTFSKENPTNHTLVPWREGYSTLGNPGLFFGDTGSATFMGEGGKPVQVRMDNMQDRLSGPAKQRLNQLFGSAL